MTQVHYDAAPDEALGMNTATDAPARYQRWTDDEITRLRELLDEGHRLNVIAGILGRPTRGLYQRVRRLRQEGATEYRCSACRQHKPAADFTAGSRFTGAYCRRCRNALPRS